MCENVWDMMIHDESPAFAGHMVRTVRRHHTIWCVLLRRHPLEHDSDTLLQCCEKQKFCIRDSCLKGASQCHFFTTHVLSFSIWVGWKKPLQSKDGLRAAVRWASKRLWFELPTFRCACKPLNCKVILCAPPSKKNSEDNRRIFWCLNV